MSRAALLILFAFNAAVAAWAGESRIDDALLSAAQKAMPREVATNELVRVLQATPWHSPPEPFRIQHNPKRFCVGGESRPSRSKYLIDNSRGKVILRQSPLQRTLETVLGRE